MAGLKRGYSLPTRGVPYIEFPEIPGAILFGGTGDPPPVETALKRAREVEREFAVRVHLVDAAAVCGPAHLASALAHARRSHDRGRARARDLKVELMLYLTGKRQIARAIAAAGLSPKTRGVALAVEGPVKQAADAAVALLHALDLSRDDEVLAASEKKARTLGVSGSADDPLGWESLALEVVAMLDLE